MGYFVLIVAFVIPIVIAIFSGGTYTLAFSVAGIGMTLYFGSNVLIAQYIRKRAPEFANDQNWEATAGFGIVPKWVSQIGLMGTGLAPSGAVIALLLYLEVISRA